MVPRSRSLRCLQFPPKKVFSSLDKRVRTGRPVTLDLCIREFSRRWARAENIEVPVGKALTILAPKISRSDAENIIRKVLRRHVLLGVSRLKRVELIHVPFHAFRCRIQDKSDLKTVTAVGDALEGQYAATLRKFEELGDNASITIPTPQLSAKSVQPLVVDHVRWLLIQGKLFRIHGGELQDCEYINVLAYPFWVGYVERRGRYNIQVVDAISGERTGPQLRRLLLLAIRLLSKTQA